MTRTCRSCSERFASAEACRTHRRDYTCRSPDTLRALGWRLTPQGWQHAAAYARRKG